MCFYSIELMSAPAAKSKLGRHSPFGAKTPKGAPFSQTILSAKYWDGDTKLYYYGYRYLNPGMARWVSRDPIGERSFRNLYCAFKNSPIYRFDPFGLTCKSVAKEGFKTDDEQTKIKKMEEKKCDIPKIKCKCCFPPEKKGEFDGKNVFLCEAKDRTDEEYRKIRKHELSHAFDKCMGAKLACSYTSYDNNLCSELRAYSWANGLSGSDLYEAACTSTALNCAGIRQTDGGYGTFMAPCRYRASQIAKQCTGVGPTEPLPQVPPPPETSAGGAP